MYKIDTINYKIIQLIPVKSNKNNRVTQVIELTNQMHRGTSLRLDKKGRTINASVMPKLSFYIHTTPTSIKFFMMIPEEYYIDTIQTCRTMWRNIQIEEIDELPLNLKETVNYELHYNNEDCLALESDMRNNNLMNSNIQSMSNLQDEEEVGILYNFIPTSEKESNYFHMKSKRNIAKYKEGANLGKNKTLKECMIIVGRELIGFLNEMLVKLINAKPKELESLTRKLSTSTSNKLSENICNTQIIICAKSKNKVASEVLAERVCGSYKAIKGDNSLVFTKVTKPIDIKRTRIPHVRVNKISISECSNFVNMPSTEVINQFNLIDHNKVLQLDAPNCLLSGEIRIGKVINKESCKDVFYSSDKEIGRMGRVLLGGMGSGKTYYMQNLSKDIMKTKRSLVVIDYIDKCQLAKAIEEITPKDRIVEIDFTNPAQVQSFNFNEIIPRSNSVTDRLSAAMLKAQQMQLLLDSINDDDSKLSPRMLRYLISACSLVYYIKPFASFKQITEILKNKDIRADIISKLSSEELELLADEVEDLCDLNKINDKGVIVGNYDNKVEGIIDRVAWLKTNLFTKLAFNKEANNNINFSDTLNKAKVIIIKIPERDFNTRMIRNVISTFFLNKVWIAKQMNSDNQTELFIDEIHQCHNCQLLMQNILVECRKFNLTPTLALHNLGQLTNKMKMSLMSSGVSFILISGCDTSVYKDLASRFDKDGYTEVDLSELERYHALCSIKNEKNGYSSFIVKLPS